MRDVRHRLNSQFTLFYDKIESNILENTFYEKTKSVMIAHILGHLL